MNYIFKESFIKPYFTNKFMFQFLVRLCLILEHVFNQYCSKYFANKRILWSQIRMPGELECFVLFR